jgi:hypothetical protein
MNCGTPPEVEACTIAVGLAENDCGAAIAGSDMGVS